MRKSILILIVVGAFVAGSILTPQYAAADHDADFAILQAAFGTLLNAVINGFNAVATAIAALPLPDSVDSSHIIDNSVSSADITESFIKTVSLADSLCTPEGFGWCPNGSLTSFIIQEAGFIETSVILISLVDEDLVGASAVCMVADNGENTIGLEDKFLVVCTQPVDDGTRLNYVVING